MGTEEEKEKDYSLRKSFEKVGLLPGARLLVDQEGKIIDGVHSWIEAKKLGFKIPAVTVNIKDPGDAEIVKLVTNKCRRELEPAEITRCLHLIAGYKNWRVKDFLEHLPFSYSWLMLYLPDEYKDPVKARAGAMGGRATARALHEARKSAAKLQPKSQDSRHEEPVTEASLKGREQPAEEEDLKKPKAEAEILPVQEPHERFNSMFSSHLSDFASLLSRIGTIEKEDLPALLDYVEEKHDCAKCDVKISCKKFLQLYEELMDWQSRILTLLPDCIRNKINNSSL